MALHRAIYALTTIAPLIWGAHVCQHRTIKGRTMRIFGTAKVSALAGALAVIAARLHPASAQDAATPGGMQFFVTPYLWLSGINATTKTPLPQEPEVNSDVSAH
jgi:hypothetical protein